MLTLADLLLEHDLRPRHHRDGNQKLVCPRCSHRRRKVSDLCLSLTIEGERALWNCHHCQWSGAVNERNTERTAMRSRSRPAPVRPARAPDDPSPEVLRWLSQRGIGEATARRNRVGSARQYIPALGREVDCIAYPFFRAGELVNVKCRALESKAFTQVKDAENIAFGIDDIADATTVVIVEGECDKLALDEAGIRNVVSVPNGAQTGPRAADDSAPAFAWISDCAEYLHRAEKIVLAVDADDKGRALETELARRLGRERCWRVRWPDSNDAPCKDANETLIAHGADVLRECIEAAEPYPIAGLHNAVDFWDEVSSLYREGRQRGLSTGWPSLDEYMTIRPGEVSVVTGIPNHGKSEFLDALAVNLARLHGWRFAMCSFENPPEEHLAKLAEKYLGSPFWDGPTRRMTEAELMGAIRGWIADRFHLIRFDGFDDEAPTIEAILEKARIAVVRHGIRGLIIDPYNEIEHRRPPHMTETEYVSQLLSKVKRFAQMRGVHVWIVAHPKLLPRQNNGSLPVPTLYDISGGANWANKADIGLAVHRPGPESDTQIAVHKVRFKAVGKPGRVTLRWDRATGRYSEIPPSSYGAGRA
jgi:twinkle protein